MMQNKAPFGEKELSDLRQAVAANMSPKRFAHTAAVEDMAARLAAVYCPDMTNLLRAAALLHDTTKECDVETHMDICRRFGETVGDADRLAHKTLHARTAALLIPEDYPTFAHETVISAVRWHTTGHAGMTLADQLLYLADYIDDSRLFPDCVRLRTFFWSANPATLSPIERERLLRRTLIMSFDMTMRALVNEGALISPDTAFARNELILADQLDTP